MKKFRRLPAATAAACLTVGLSAAPAVAAAPAKAQSSAKTTRSAPKARASVNNSANALRRRIVENEEDLRGTSQSIDALKKLAEENQNGVRFIAAAAPQLIAGLTALRDGSLQLKAGLEQAGAGLIALRDALEDDVRPALERVRDELVPAVEDIGKFIGAPEYGFGQVLTSTGGAPTAEQGAFVETPDIPDFVQQAQTSQTFIAQTTGNVIVVYGVRSGEKDGKDGNPAALCRVTVQNENSNVIDKTDGGPTGLGFIPVDDKSKLTNENETSFPFGPVSTDNTQTFVSTVGIAAGNAYTVTMSCVDTSPDEDDPRQ